jgi:hypothetical protein
MENGSTLSPAKVNALVHYPHLLQQLKAMQQIPQKPLVPCPCGHCTRPASQTTMASLRILSAQLAQHGCTISVPVKPTAVHASLTLAAMSRLLHAIDPIDVGVAS